MRLALVASHPIQYQAPLFRELARRLDLRVFFAHEASAQDQSHAGFGVAFNWDVDLLGGYRHAFLKNVARRPGLERFSGCDTPGIREYLLAGGFDAVLLMGWHLKCYWQAIQAAKRAGIPVMVRGDSELGAPRNLLKRIGKAAIYPPALRIFDAALWVGERSREYWLHYRYPADRLFHSPHCVDNEWFAAHSTKEAGRELRARHGIEAGTKVVLFAGKLIEGKRPEDIVCALARLPHAQRPVMLVAGDGPLRERLRAAASAAEVTVVPLGFCNQSRMPGAYAAADVLVVPSEWETWGLVVNEALACGRPVIVSDRVACAPEVREFFGSRSIYPMGNASALADRIESILASPPSAGKLARASAALSLERAADGICEAVASCARGLSSGRGGASRE